VRPELGYLDGSGIATERGILVDDTMRTSAADVWSAGDCAQARGFFTDTPVMNAILPDATVQGRIAGMAMADDPGLKPYQGGVPLNTYHFFGRHAISVGSAAVPEGGAAQVRFDAASGRYLRAVFDRDDRLTGIFGVNEFFDAGVDGPAHRAPHRARAAARALLRPAACHRPRADVETLALRGTPWDKPTPPSPSTPPSATAAGNA